MTKTYNIFFYIDLSETNILTSDKLVKFYLFANFVLLV